jgi:hypothetical protein
MVYQILHKYLVNKNISMMFVPCSLMEELILPCYGLLPGIMVWWKLDTHFIRLTLCQPTISQFPKVKNAPTGRFQDIKGLLGEHNCGIRYTPN